MRLPVRLALLVAAIAITPAFAQPKPTDKPEYKPGVKNEPSAKDEPKLKIGDPAPPLTVSKWHRGPEVRAFEKDKVYVVVFWESRGIPGLARVQAVQALHAKYKEIIPVAVGVGKEKPKPGEPSAEDEAAYLKEANGKHTFGFASDPEGKTREAYGGRFGTGNVFVIGKDGKIAYIAGGFDVDRHLGEVVAKVLNGTWQGQKDVDALNAVGEEVIKAVPFQEKLRAIQPELKGASREKVFEAIAKLAVESQKSLDDVLQKYPDYKSNPQVLVMQLQLAVRAGNQEAAEKALEALLKPGLDLGSLDTLGPWLNDVARDVIYDSLNPKITPSKLAAPVADAILKGDIASDRTGEYLYQIGHFVAIMGAPDKAKELLRKMVEVSTRLPADQKKTVLAQLEKQIDDLVKQLEEEKKKSKK